jgi:serine phosphatase RsbU (regulator of sigma subunit)
MSAPLVADGLVIGALTVVSSGSGRRFDAEDLSLMEELAAQVSSVVERERRYDIQRQVAHVLQQSMLPDELDLPDGVRAAARYIASNEAAEVGGDFYDVVRVDPSHVVLAVGDVEGHDLVASTVMAKVRSAMRAYLAITTDLPEVLSMLDRFVRDHVHRRLSTLLLAMFETTTGELTLASAAHPQALRLGDDNCVEALEAPPGAPLGLGYGGYTSSRYSIPVGGGIALYTDGLIETRTGGPTGRLDRLIQALKVVSLDRLDEACDAVIARTLGEDLPDDDIAVLLVARIPFEMAE